MNRVRVKKWQPRLITLTLNARGPLAMISASDIYTVNVKLYGIARDGEIVAALTSEVLKSAWRHRAMNQPALLATRRTALIITNEREFYSSGRTERCLVNFNIFVVSGASVWSNGVSRPRVTSHRLDSRLIRRFLLIKLLPSIKRIECIDIYRTYETRADVTIWEMCRPSIENHSMFSMGDALNDATLQLSHCAIHYRRQRRSCSSQRRDARLFQHFIRASYFNISRGSWHKKKSSTSAGSVTRAPSGCCHTVPLVHCFFFFFIITINAFI